MTVEDITVGQLIEALRKMPEGSKVRVWLPGSTIYLGSVFSLRGMTMIEGNITPGSVLSRENDDMITIEPGALDGVDDVDESNWGEQ